MIKITEKANELKKRYSEVISRICKMEIWERLDKISKTTNLKVYDLACKLSDVDLFNHFTELMYEDYCFFKIDNDNNVIEKYIGRTSSFFLDTDSNIIEYYREAQGEELEFLKFIAYDNLGYSDENIYLEIEDILKDHIGYSLTSDEIDDIFSDVENEIGFLEDFIDKDCVYEDILEDVKAVERIYKYIENQKECAVDDFKEYFYENCLLKDVCNIESKIQLQEKDLKNPLITKEIMFIANNFEKKLLDCRDLSLEYTSIDNLIKASKDIKEIEVYDINIMDFIDLMDKIRLIQITEQNINMNIFNKLKVSFIK